MTQYDCGLFELDGTTVRYLGAALLTSPYSAVLTSQPAKLLWRNGIERHPRRYWLITGPDTSSLEGLYGGPVYRLRIAEEPDKDGTHYIGVELDLTGWTAGRVPLGVQPFSREAATQADAARIGEQLKGLGEVGRAWLATAQRAVAHFRTLGSHGSDQWTVPHWVVDAFPDPESSSQPSGWPGLFGWP